MKDLRLLVGEYQESLAGRGLSKSYVSTEGTILRVFSEFWGDQDIRELSANDFYGYVIWLKNRETRFARPMKPEAVFRYADSLRRFGFWLYRREYLLINPVQNVELKEPPSAMRKIPSEEEISMVLNVVLEERDRALFELLYSCGLRIQEALNLELADVNLEERVLMIRHGKGKKDRYVPFGVQAQMHLKRYIQGQRTRETAKLKDDKRHYMFLRAKGRMSRATAANRWKTALEKVGLENSGYTLHSIRHATGTHLLENGAGIRYVQELLGHECLNTTQRYTRPNRDKIKATYRTFHPRENELYKEITEEYRIEASRLKEEILANLETQKRKLARYAMLKKAS